MGRFRIHVSAMALAAFISGLPATVEAGPFSGIGGGIGRSVERQFIQERQPVLAPMGFVVFCSRNPSECRGARGGASPVSLTNGRMDVLRGVNTHVNRSIRGVPDRKRGGRADSWQIASRQGDCEDFALAKRKLLISRGWSPASLRIAVATTPSGEGHAVLVVRTSSGDVVLDNRHDRILPWRSTDLRWVKIQSGNNPHLWFAI